MGSICEIYLIDEITNFASHYFIDDVQTIWNPVPRNDDGGPNNLNGLSIFFPYLEKKCP